MTIMRGLLMTCAVLSMGLDASAEERPLRVLTDFSAPSPWRWYTVNDGVMGGRSRGGFLVEDGVLVFSGSTNTNGGGFSSIRTRTNPVDLTGFDGIRVRVKADGRRYTFRLTTSNTRQGRYVPSYWADFQTRKGAEWQDIDVPFARFKPRWRGRALAGPALDLSKIDSLGLMIYDKLDGPFRLEATSIHAYRQRREFTMASYRSERRPLVVFAPRWDDSKLKRQLAGVDKARAGFDERDMTLIVVVGDGVSLAGNVAMSKADAKALRAKYEVGSEFSIRLVGKDGTVKRSGSDVVDMASIFALIDGMPMRKREIEGGS